MFEISHMVFLDDGWWVTDTRKYQIAKYDHVDVCAFKKQYFYSNLTDY